jgi:Family of unknown function (DUF6463)
MMRIAGLWWIAIGVIHGLVGTIVFFDQWKAIAQDGWFNVIAPNPLAPIFDREDAFWFMMLAPFFLILGQLCLWAFQRKGTFPASVGIILVITVLIGLSLEPISGIWLGLPPSLMLLWLSRMNLDS